MKRMVLLNIIKFQKYLVFLLGKSMGFYLKLSGRTSLRDFPWTSNSRQRHPVTSARKNVDKQLLSQLG